MIALSVKIEEIRDEINFSLEIRLLLLKLFQPIVLHLEHYGQKGPFPYTEVHKGPQS